MLRLAAAVAMSLWSSLACAETIKIGLALNGQQPGERALAALRDGFELGLRHAGANPGGHALSIAVMPAGEGNDTAARLEAFVKAEAPRILVAAVPQADPSAQLKAFSDAGVMVLRPTPGGADLAGKRCLANVFVTNSQLEQPLDAISRYIENAPQKRNVVIYAESMAGAVEAFKRSNGFLRLSPIADDEASYAGAIEKLLLDQPQQVVIVASPATSARFLGQLRQAPGGADIGIIATALFEEGNIAAFGELAEGVLAPGVWATGLESKNNSDFITAFSQGFGYLPTSYAVFGYDTAQLIAQGLSRAQTPVTAATLRDAMRTAQLDSPRGTVTFSNNNFPVQDIYIKRVERQEQNVFRTVPVSKVFVQYGDDFAAECPLR